MLQTRPTYERPLSPADEEETRDDPALERQQEQMRNHVRTECFDILHDAYRNQDSALSFKDLTDYMKGLEEEKLTGADDHRKKMEWLQNMTDKARVFASETIDVGSRLMKGIRDAKGDDISDASLERWQKRLKARPHGEQWPDTRRQLEEFLRQKLPELREAWKLLSSDIKEVQALANALGVSASDMKELAALEDRDFKNAKFPARRRKVTAALKALRNRKKSWKKRPERATEGTRFYDEVRSHLMEAVREGSMARTKVGAWLKRTFASQDLDKAKTFYRTTVRPCTRNWKIVRRAYDLVTNRMQEEGVPRGFNPVAVDQFLLMSYDQRQSYVEELGHRLTDKEMNEKDSIVGLRVGIRHELDTRFWEGADRLLQQALKEYPDDPQFQSMQRYLDAHRDDQEGSEANKETSASAMNIKVRELIQTEIPTCLHIVYEHTLAAGPKAFGALASQIFNRVWVHEHGYSNEALDYQDAHDESHKAKTEKRIEEGHEQVLEKNRLDGSTAEDHAIRDECHSPQALYIDASTEAQLAVTRKSIKNQENWGFKYWTTLVPRDVSYGQQEHIVKHVNNKVKALAWKLHALGFSYSSFGPPISRN